MNKRYAATEQEKPGLERRTNADSYLVNYFFIRMILRESFHVKAFKMVFGWD